MALEPVPEVGPEHRHLAPVQAGHGHQAVERVDLGVTAGQRFEGGDQAGPVDVRDEPQRLGAVGRVDPHSEVVEMDRGLARRAGPDQVRHGLHDHQPEAFQDGEEPGELDAALAVTADAEGALVAVMIGAHRQPVLASEGGAHPRPLRRRAGGTRPGRPVAATSRAASSGGGPLSVAGRHPGREAGRLGSRVRAREQRGQGCSHADGRGGARVRYGAAPTHTGSFAQPAPSRRD